MKDTISLLFAAALVVASCGGQGAGGGAESRALPLCEEQPACTAANNRCEGDVAVIADRFTVIGASEAEHDLTSLSDARLRSHGALSEAVVPFILNRPLSETYRQRAGVDLRSHQIFDYAINGTVA